MRVICMKNSLCSNATGSKHKISRRQQNTTPLFQEYNTAFAMRHSNNQDKKKHKEESEDEESSEESRSEEDSSDGSEDSVPDVAVKTPECVATTKTLPASKEKKIAVDSGTPKGDCKKSGKKCQLRKGFSCKILRNLLLLNPAL